MSCSFTAAQAARVLTGPQPLSTNFINGPYTPPAGVYFSGIHAADASWEGEFFNLIKFRHAQTYTPWYSAHWCGGLIKGTFPAATSWDRMHSAYALTVENNLNATVRHMRIHNTGDAFNYKDGADGWSLDDCHVSIARDDAVQNDYGMEGHVQNCLFDGLYSFYSSRPYVATIPDNSWKYVIIEKSLARLVDMPTTYHVGMPGHAKFFKMDNSAQAGWPGHPRDPKLILRELICRVDTTHEINTDFYIPPPDRAESTDCIMVWGGTGSFPYPVYPGWTVTTDTSVWDNARAAWLAAHPELALEIPFP